jgi:hypothetical protein
MLAATAILAVDLRTRGRTGDLHRPDCFLPTTAFHADYVNQFSVGKPRTFSKCASAVTSVQPAEIAMAAIRISNTGNGRPD